MQDYVKLLEATSRSGIQRKLNVKNGSQQQFKLLELIEEMSTVLRRRLDEVMPQHLTHKVQKVKLDLMENPVDAQVLIKAQFYKHDRRNFQLRVYVHQQGKKGRSVKLARAIYYISISSNGVEKVA